MGAAGQPVGDPDLVLTVETTVADQLITLRLHAGYNDFIIDWGEGEDTHFSGAPGGEVFITFEHTYAAIGLHQIRMSGLVAGFYFNNRDYRLYIVEISNWGSTPFTNANGAFYGCSNLLITATDSYNKFSTATSMASTFFSVQSPLDLAQYGSSVATSYDYFMYNNEAISGPFDVGALPIGPSVTNLNNVFNSCDDLEPYGAGNWDISNVTTMVNLFRRTKLTDTDLDDMLIGWAAQAPNIQHGVPCTVGPAHPSSQAGIDAEALLVNTYGWVFNNA